MFLKLKLRILVARLLLSMPCLLLLPTPAQAQNGDLYYGVGWEAIAGNPDGWQTSIWLEMWDQFGQLDEDSGATYAVVFADVPAHIINNRVDVYGEAWELNPWFGWQYYASVSDNRTLAGAGPGNVNIKIAAFIPEDALTSPNTSETMWILMEGDNRGFGLYAGSSRLTQILDVYNTAVEAAGFAFGPDSAVGLSVEYEGWTSIQDGPCCYLKQEARDDWQLDYPMKLRWDFAVTTGMHCDPPESQGQQYGAETSTTTVYCVGAATYPFYMLAPAIDWRYSIQLTFGNNGFDYNVAGCHDGYPNHEMYLNGHPVFQDWHQTQISLFPPCESIPTKTGSVR